jgi:flagellar biosynthetic protein FliR
MLLDPGRGSLQYVLPVVEHGPSMWQLGPIIGMELLVGFTIGYGASLPLMGLQVAGRMVDQQLGMGLAGIFNPEVGDQTGVVGQFYFMLGLAIFIILGGHRALLLTLVESFDHVPLGGFVADGRLLYLITGILGAMFELAVRVAAPLLCIIFLETLALGFIARTVPQMNILSIGFPLRILAGMFMVIGALAVDMAVYRETASDVLSGISQFFRQWDVAGGG